jgi:hypothetical protein
MHADPLPRWSLMVASLSGAAIRAPLLAWSQARQHRLVDDGDDGSSTLLPAHATPAAPRVPHGFVQVNAEGMRIGESHPRAKLTDAEADTLYALHAAGTSYRVLALRFGISKSCAAGIVQGRRRGQAIERIKRVAVAV